MGPQPIPAQQFDTHPPTTYTGGSSDHPPNTYTGGTLDHPQTHTPVVPQTTPPNTFTGGTSDHPPNTFTGGTSDHTPNTYTGGTSDHRSTAQQASTTPQAVLLVHHMTSRPTATLLAIHASTCGTSSHGTRHQYSHKHPGALSPDNIIQTLSPPQLALQATAT